MQIPAAAEINEMSHVLLPCHFSTFITRNLAHSSFPFNAGAGSNSPYLSASTCRPHGMVNGQRSLDLCSHSPDCRQPSPLTSPLLNDAGSIRTDDEDEVRRKVCNRFIQLVFCASKLLLNT